MNVAHRVGLPRGEFGHLLGLAPEHLGDDLCRPPAATINRIAELTVAHAPWTDVSQLLAQQSTVGALGVWDYLITCAATPLEGIKDAAASFAVVADPATETLTVTEDGDHVTIGHLNHADLANQAACAIRGFALGLYRQRLSQAAGRPVIPLRVTLTTQAPRRHDTLTELYGTRAIDFEAPASSLTFLASDLETPNPLTQPGLPRVLRQVAEQQLTTATPLYDWLHLFRRTLSFAHAEGAPTLAAVAQRMTISTRTLQRRLEDHGTTWNTELEALRRTQITHLLQKTDYGVDAIAARTGYKDGRSLRRAVHRWYGTTPSALRGTNSSSSSG
ncbi:AraC family transcriptional regulator [Streptomyces sp. WP-1]|uniref:AraC family transcriptional regulator n=1 Tax=Streptomyces sp. WP-1 TaxID=3041497 RepID=UPI002648E0F4|nr:AraC family transcriptional regulator [Streptomyces sp. WP-1]WKE68479.1 helix-turn-helix domain-containing protein [Streptomyces sp. WP-1]